MWSFLLFACSQAPPPRDWVAEFDRDPQAVIAAVASLSDPVQQEAVVITLCEAYPGYTAELCPALAPGAARERCERFNERPHLWSITTPADPGKGRLGLPETLMQRWADQAANSGTCGGGDHGCLEENAARFAARGELEAVASVCKAFGDTRLVNDCFFSASEQVPMGDRLYAQAMLLCAGSGMYAHECHGHVLLRLAAEGRAGVEAEALLAEEQRIRQFWDAHDAAFGTDAVDLYWSTIMARQLGTLQPFPQPVLTTLPDRLMPHLRSAVALRVIEEARPIAVAQSVFAGAPPSLRRAQLPPMMPEIRLWQTATPHPEIQSWIFFNDVRGGRRPVHSDPDIDLHLAVMTAVAMKNPPRIDVLHALMEDERPVVQWGARSLLEEIQ